MEIQDIPTDNRKSVTEVRSSTPQVDGRGGGTFANLCGMSEENIDPSGNTAAFRAFANTPEPAVSEPPAKTPLFLGIGFAALLVLALALWLALG